MPLLGWYRAYARWLHTQWPAGTLEKLPLVNEDGTTNVPGLYIVGDLTGIPLLKFSADSGAKAVRHIQDDASFQSLREARTGEADGDDVKDVVIVGGGVSGMAAALEAKKLGLSYTLLEAADPFSTIVNFPKGKPIFTYPTDMTPAGDLQFTAQVKEPLVDELREQTRDVEITVGRAERVRRAGKLMEVVVAGGDPLRARRVIIGIGRSGNFRKLGVPGEALDKVINRLHDPKDYVGKHVLVVGGGDSAIEAAIALVQGGANVTLSYRKKELTRPKPENVERLMRLADDIHADVDIEQPSSERQTTSTGRWVKDALRAQATDTSGASLTLALGSQIKQITDDSVTLDLADEGEQTTPNDAVFAMIGREPPLDFFRRSGVTIQGDFGARFWAGFAAFFGFCALMYHWKSFGPVKGWFAERGWFPYNAPDGFHALGAATYDPSTLLGTLTLTSKDAAFWYSLAYTLCIVIFGYRRIRRRKTPYVTRQTTMLALVQIVPLFLLPFVVLPWMGHNGWFGKHKQVNVLQPSQIDAVRAAWAEVPEWKDAPSHLRHKREATAKMAARGALPAACAGWSAPLVNKVDGSYAVFVDGGLDDPGQRVAEVKLSSGVTHVLDKTEPDSWTATQLFPIVKYDDNGREYWRASGLILAWPLFIWNVFTGKPMWLWLGISLIQTFVLIPLLIFKWGKGAYCGWICSCGALAETMGDAHRHKMPHGPFWNRLNMIGQWFLWSAFALLILRVISWIWTDGLVARTFAQLLSSGLFGYKIFSYAYLVDLWWAGIIGVGCYFHFSGRVWCRFACPLAALMHIYARFTRFRIFADKKKCISCNVCTSVCHQGIDIMNFANKGVPMQDPECVRCSACVQSCPTGVLRFGEIASDGSVLRYDPLAASPVQMAEQAADKETS